MTIELAALFAVLGVIAWVEFWWRLAAIDTSPSEEFLVIRVPDHHAPPPVQTGERQDPKKTVQLRHFMK